MSVVVSDTGPLHYLILCRSIDLLPRLFAQVYIPPTVHRELTHAHTPIPVHDWAQQLPSWLEIKTPTHMDATLNLDPGETEAICLAQEIKASGILMDDRKGRHAAQARGLLVTGTIGILYLGAKRGLVDLPQAVEMLRQTNVRLDPEVINAALNQDRTWREQQIQEARDLYKEFPR